METWKYDGSEGRKRKACARNARGYYLKYGNSWFNNRENDNAYYLFRLYCNCYYYSSFEAEIGEEDDL